jgi:hypothetical protein
MERKTEESYIFAASDLKKMDRTTKIECIYIRIIEKIQK